jgi:predicted Rdx family selenoprotein
MSILQFLFGKDLNKKNVNFTPGTFYLDTATKELWYDDPDTSIPEDKRTHQRIVDTTSLTYDIVETTTYGTD